MIIVEWIYLQVVGQQSLPLCLQIKWWKIYKKRPIMLYVVLSLFLFLNPIISPLPFPNAISTEWILFVNDEISVYV